MTHEERPALRLIHGLDSLSPSKLAWFRARTTAELIASLAAGDGCLKCYRDGTVVDGHHRLLVLRERGVDIDTLPRPLLRERVRYDEDRDP